MNIRAWVPLCCCVLFLASPAGGEVIVDLIDGADDSGWSVVLADGLSTGVVVDGVSSDSVFVRIEVFKTLTEGPVGGLFPPNVVSFRQRLDDADTVPTIRIAGEVVVNRTGRDWTGYRWELDGNAVGFDKASVDGGDFDFAPFTTYAWGPAPARGNLADHATSLAVAGGTVPDNGLFLVDSDYGDLDIDIDLAAAEDPAEFTLRQSPVPEPVTAGTLAAGLAAICLTNRTRRRGRSGRGRFGGRGRR